MSLKLVYYNNPVLRKKASPVTEFNAELKDIAYEMLDVMHKSKGIGLAAPQVNLSIQLIVMDVPVQNEAGLWQKGQVRYFVNPKIISLSEETDTECEGCLSVPGIFSPVERSIALTAEAYDLDGNLFTVDLKDLEAKCLSHEYDHLQGMLFVDRVSPEEKKAIQGELEKIDKKFNC